MSNPFLTEESAKTCYVLNSKGKLVSFTKPKNAKRLVESKKAIFLDNNSVQLLDDDVVCDFLDSDPYFQVARPFQCVCCSSKDRITQHHIVPRGFWPILYPFGTMARMLMSMHDIQYLCEPCHKIYENHVHASSLKDAYFFPPNEDISRRGSWANELLRSFKFIINKEWLAKTHLSGYALQNTIGKVKASIKIYLVKLDLKGKSYKEIITLCKKYKNHFDSEEVFNYIAAKVHKLESRHEFVMMWRQHFIETMKPKYMPPFWRVDMSIFDAEDSVDSMKDYILPVIGKKSFPSTPEEVLARHNAPIIKVLDAKDRLVSYTTPKKAKCNNTFIKLSYLSKESFPNIDPFFHEDRSFLCVCCGANEEITQHHIVPAALWKHIYDNHVRHIMSAHDVQFLCVRCHQVFERRSAFLKNSYWVDPPLNIQKTSSKSKNLLKSLRFVMNKEVSELLINEEKKLNRLRNCKNHIKKLLVDLQLQGKNYKEIVKSCEENMRSCQEAFNNKKNHMKDLVEQHDKFELVKIWRKAFIKNGWPKHLSPLWRIDMPISWEQEK